MSREGIFTNCRMCLSEEVSLSPLQEVAVRSWIQSPAVLQENEEEDEAEFGEEDLFHQQVVQREIW